VRHGGNQDMKIVNYCVCCGSNDIKTYPGMLADFISYRIFGHDHAQVNRPEGSYPLQTRCDILHCNNCNYIGSKIRFDDDELNLIYHDYRSESYVQDRAKFEPSYPEQNGPLSYDPLHIKTRIENLSSLLLSSADINKIRTLIDYGGGEGQFIPEIIPANRKIIFDPSNKILKNGLESISNIADLPVADFVMLCHTLEHLSYPKDILIQIRDIMHTDSLLYIEVPLEVADDHPLMDYEIPRVTHEHINRFTTQSLKALLDVAGYVPIKIYIAEIISSYFGRDKIISALCVKK
jgi:Methyltransferase domain